MKKTITLLAITVTLVAFYACVETSVPAETVPATESHRAEHRPVAPEPEPLIVEAAPQVRQDASAKEAEWFARIAASEVNFESYERDTDALLQTLENMRADWGGTLLEAMYRQSPHVTRRKDFTTPRQVWVSYLPIRGDGPPSKGWIECTGIDRTDPNNEKSTPEGCTGVWKATVGMWTSMRQYAMDLYYSGRIPDGVEGRPIQWGGKMDTWRGVGRGFCPLESGPTKNTFWGRPSENAGKCKPVSQEEVDESRMVSVSLMRRHMERAAKARELAEN